MNMEMREAERWGALTPVESGRRYQPGAERLLLKKESQLGENDASRLFKGTTQKIDRRSCLQDRLALDAIPGVVVIRGITIWANHESSTPFPQTNHQPYLPVLPRRRRNAVSSSPAQTYPSLRIEPWTLFTRRPICFLPDDASLVSGVMVLARRAGRYRIGVDRVGYYPPSGIPLPRGVGEDVATLPA